jgi:bifunctional DNA-binding transcriptional regulator/antitoxin component of YhaV-PrlF toxin-antitoxin module
MRLRWWKAPLYQPISGQKFHCNNFAKNFILPYAALSCGEWDMKHTTWPHGRSTRVPGVSEPAAEYASGPVVTIDTTGRMVLPKKIREHYGADRFVVRETQGHIELIPVKPLGSLLGILPDLDIGAVYRDHDREV